MYEATAPAAQSGEEGKPGGRQTSRRSPDRPRRLLVLASMLAAVVAIAVLVLSGALTAGGQGAVHGPPGRVLFDGDFSRGLDPEPGQHVVHPERIAIVPDPLGRSREVARFTVFDSDIGPTENPRATVATPPDLTSGEDVWMGWSTLFPRHGFPASVPGWLTFEAVYGPPGTGPGPRHLQVEGSSIVWRRNETYHFDEVWRMSLIRGRWIDFVVHQRQSSDPRAGYVELWVNTGSGWKQQRIRGQLRFHTRTLDSSNDASANWHSLGQYRKRGMFKVATLYQADHRLGTSFRAVAPDSYG
jgi:hypothetical protein